MKLKTLSVWLGSISLALFTGCSTEGEFRESSSTFVALTGNNYKIIKTGVAGHSSGFSLLGIIPITDATHAAAKASLYQSIDLPMTGKSLALANTTEDRSCLYLILFSIPKISVTADVIEFMDTPGGVAAPAK